MIDLKRILQMKSWNRVKSIQYQNRKQQNQQSKQKSRLDKQIVLLFFLHLIHLTSMISTYTQPISQQYTLPQTQFSHLNLSSCSISVINQIGTKLLFISSLNLDNNLLKSLEGIDQFMNLEVLSLNFNFIQQKEELLRLNNKFLVKQLSFIGNRIQNQVSLNWFKQNGFTALLKVNDVAKIGIRYKNQHLAQPNQVFITIKESPSQSPFCHRSLIYQPNSSSSKKHRNLHHTSVLIEPHLQTIPSSERVFLTKRSTKIHNKSKQGLQSTGYTRKYKIDSNRMGQTSRQSNLNDQILPKFNDPSNLPQQYYTDRSRRISEFKLYPVHQNHQQSVQQIESSKRVQMNQQIQSNYDNYQNYPHFVRPFQPVSEHYYQGQDGHRFIHNSTQKPLITYTRTSQSQQVQNQKNSDFDEAQRIPDQIPIYKQAISIAFYYRNLLQKVFRGFNKTINSKIKQIYPQSSPTKKSFDSSHQEVNHSLLRFQRQLHLKKYAFMMIQLYAQTIKIKQKYYNSKFHNQ